MPRHLTLSSGDAIWTLLSGGAGDGGTIGCPSLVHLKKGLGEPAPQAAGCASEQSLNIPAILQQKLKTAEAPLAEKEIQRAFSADDGLCTQKDS